MNYTDRPDVPKVILSALTDPTYSTDLNDHMQNLPPEVRSMRSLSVTTLPRSPRQRILEARHSGEVTVDPVDDGFWKMFGHVIHSILEEHAEPGDLVEERKGITVNGVYVHGQADIYSPPIQRLDDYKITKAASMLYGDKSEHHYQLNVLALIWKLNGFPVKSIRNVFLFRDFDPRQVKEGSLYPKSHIEVHDVPLWDDKVTIQYIKDRVRLHLEPESLDDDQLPYCTNEERWMGLPEFKVYKMDLDKESGLFKPQSKAKIRSNSKLECQTFIDDPVNKHPKLKVKGKNTDELDTSKEIQFSMIEVPAKPTRCSFCNYFQWCNQRQIEVASQSTDTEEESDGLPSDASEA